MNDENNKDNKPNLKKVFSEAVQMMGPAMISAIGTRDPQKIYAAYVQGQEQYRKDKELEYNRQAQLAESNRRLASDLQPNFDMGFVDKSTNQVVKVDKNTGRAFTLDNKLLKDTSNIVHEESFRQARTLPFRDKGLTLKESELDLEKKKLLN